MRTGWQRQVLAALATGLLFGVAAWTGVVLSEIGRVAPIWVANGILLGLLLMGDRSQWLVRMAAALVANILVNTLSGDVPSTAILLALCNTVEVGIAFHATAPFIRRAADLSEPRALMRFSVAALVIAPAIAAASGALILTVSEGLPLLPSFGWWFAADSIGMGIMAPLMLALRPGEVARMLRNRSGVEIAWPVATLALVTILVFAQSHYPLLFMVLPPLLLVAFRLGFSGAAIGIFLIASIALVFTLMGSGPFTLVAGGSVTTRVIALQALLGTTILTSYPVCAVLARLHELLNAIAASEQRLRAIAENSNDVIVLTDGQGIRRYVSPAVERLLGYKPEELIGTHGSGLVHPEDAQRFRDGTKRLLEGKEQVVGTFRLRRKDGEYVWVESSAKQLSDARTGVSKGWVSAVRDVSARKRIDRLKDEFISTVSHELRTPLTSMLGALGLAASGQFANHPERLARLIEMARANGERLARLVNDILDFEKVSSGAMPFSLQPVFVDDLVARAVAASQHYAEPLDVTITTDLKSAARICVDPIRFEQVMANLLSNAAKFSHRGGTVEVTTVAHNDRCTISVRDYGVGIPDAFKSAIFDRFAQADSSDRRMRGGTGLGMAITRHMTEGMGGTVRFESEEGVGTIFYLEFPRVDVALAATAAS